MMSDKPILNVDEHVSWRSWLEEHHAKTSEAWVVVQKKHSTRPGLSLDDAVEEALCFGGIDSTLNTRDDHSYMLRFSPRNPDGVWSMSNIRRVEDLEKRKLMRPPGQAAVRAAKQSGQWQAAIDRENPDFIPLELEAALQQKQGALEGYRRLPHSKRKQLVFWFESAKQEQTKQNRMAEIIRLALAMHNR
jgi:uncharacterized protein YdeI (YjbR/CyaY-like superfamily)